MLMLILLVFSVLEMQFSGKEDTLRPLDALKARFRKPVVAAQQAAMPGLSGPSGRLKGA